jgi:hypothetical protein
MPTTYLFIKGAFSSPVHGDLLVIHDPSLGTVRVFDVESDSIDDVIGVCVDKSSYLLSNQFTGLYKYADDTWTYTPELLPAYDENKDQIPNPNATSKNIFSDTDIVFVASVGSIAAVLRAQAASIPASWKLLRVNPVESTHDIYLIM